MASSSTNLDLLSAAQAQKEVTANNLLDATSPATLFGRRASTTSALTWGYYGGTLLVDGNLTIISNATIELTASQTNYVQATRAGVVSKSTTGFTAGQIPLYAVVAGSSTITSYTDYRLATPPTTGRLVKAMADANQTLSASESRNQILECTGTLAATRNLVLPLDPQQWTVFANTSGFGVQFIGASGTGITVAAGMRAIIYSDGTNIVRATADM